MKSYLGRAAAAATAVSLAVGLAACGTARQGVTPGESTAAKGGFSIGLLFPDTHTARWGTADRPLIDKRIKELCGECEVTYANASADVATQQAQVNSMIANGVRVLVLDPVDYKALRSSVIKAHDAHIPVVSYDRLAQGPVSAYSSYDSEQIGRLQAEALLTGLRHKTHHPRIVMVNGDPTDPNTGALMRGALSAFKGRARVARSYYTAGWIPENAFSNMSAAIAELGPGGIDGVYSANDGLAFGIVTALKAAHVTPLPPITGQDADLAAVQRILLGQQYVTVYKSFTVEADAAAEMAVALGRGASIDAIAKDRVANDTSKEIPAALGTPMAVTLGTIKGTVVKDGRYTLGQICTPKVQPACKSAGLIG